MVSQCELYLASSSPRRQALLRQLGVRFEVLENCVDEAQKKSESSLDYVSRLAIEKSVQAEYESISRPVLGADTSVVLNGKILGKPENQSVAQDFLLQLSGRTHEVLTAVAITYRGQTQLKVSRSRVSFRVITRAECDAYWRSGEPVGKAGGYAIQGLGACFVSHLEGSYSGVMGLPLFETAELMADVGLPILVTDRMASV